MKKTLFALAVILLILGASVALGAVLPVRNAFAQTVVQLDQWISSGSAITQRTANKAIKITGLATGDCLTLDANHLLTTVACGSGGGVSTATYPLQISGSNISSAFGTTTSNTFGGIQTFTNAPVLGSLSGLVAGNSGSLYGSATTTASCSGTVSCSTFDILGASPITITGSGSGGSTFATTSISALYPLTWNTSTAQMSTAISTSTLLSTSLAKGRFIVGNDAGIAQATSTIFISSTGNVGIGTTSPGYQFTVQQTGGNNPVAYFSKSSGAGILLQAVNNGGNAIHATNQSGSEAAIYGTGPTGVYGTSNVGTGISGYSINGTAIYGLAGNASSKAALFDGGASGYALITTNGNVGIGTTTPSQKLTINGNGYLENQGQMRFGELRANGAEYASLSATSSMASIVNWTLPAADGTNGQVLMTNGVGNLYFGSAGSGTVTSVDMSVPTGFALGGNPITGAGTLALSYAAGYSLPTTAKQTSWDNKWDLASTTIGVPYGGTGATTLSGLLQGNGTGAVTAIGGTIGQFPYYNGTNTLTATSSLLLAASGNIGIASSTPFYMLSVGTNGSKYGSIMSTANLLATTTSMTVDWTAGNQQSIRIGASATSIAFSNALPGATLTLEICNPASGTGGAVTFAGVLWPGGTPPTTTTTTNKCDLMMFRSGYGTSTPIIYGGFNQNY